MKRTLTIVLAILVAACSSPAPHFFQPVAMKSVEQTYPDVKKTILLNQVLMTADFARPQITTLGKKDYNVKIDEFNRWSAAPEKLIQRVANENLSLSLPNAVIENQTPLRKNYQYAVAIEVQEMSGRLDKFATLKASYFIKNKQNKIIKSGRFSQTIEIDGDYDAYVPAQSMLLGALCQQIAKDIANLK